MDRSAFVLLAIILLASTAIAQHAEKLNPRTMASGISLPESVFKRVEEKDVPEEVIDMNNQAVRLFLNGQVDRAVELLQKTIRLTPNFRQARANLGVIYTETHRETEAIQIFRKLIDSVPAEPTYHNALGLALYNLADFENSAAAFARAVDLSPENFHYLCNLGLAYARMQDFSRAVRAFERAVGLEPHNVEALNSFGVSLYMTGNYQEALKNVGLAVQYGPKNADYHNSLGVILTRLGKRKNALESFSKAVELQPDWALARYNLGKSYLNAGDREKAFDQFTALRKLDPELAEKFRKQLSAEYVVNVPR